MNIVISLSMLFRVVALGLFIRAALNQPTTLFDLYCIPLGLAFWVGSTFFSASTTWLVGWSKQAKK